MRLAVHVGLMTGVRFVTRASRLHPPLADRGDLDIAEDQVLHNQTDQNDRQQPGEQVGAGRAAEQGSAGGGNARALRRRFHGGSFDETLDSAGRIRVPKPLIEHAGLDGNCVVIGAGEYLQIWNADAWAKQEEELDAAAPEIAEGLAAAGTA